MALDGFILKKGQIVITIDTTSASGMQLTSSSLSYAYVEKVSALSDMYIAGDYVIFNTADAINFTFDETGIGLVSYWLTTEDKIYLTEPLIAP
jgi:hypothetical protein